MEVIRQEIIHLPFSKKKKITLLLKQAFNFFDKDWGGVLLMLLIVFPISSNILGLIMYISLVCIGLINWNNPSNSDLFFLGSPFSLMTLSFIIFGEIFSDLQKGQIIRCMIKPRTKKQKRFEYSFEDEIRSIDLNDIHSPYFKDIKIKTGLFYQMDFLPKSRVILNISQINDNEVDTILQKDTIITKVKS